jgi:hypothetical protein
MTVSQTEDMAAEVDALREQVLDLGQAVTNLTTEAHTWKRAFVLVFQGAGRPVPAEFQEQRPALSVIDGGAR